MLRKVIIANDSRKRMVVVTTQKLIDNKEYREESDHINVSGDKSQSHLTINLEIEILRNPY